MTRLAGVARRAEALLDQSVIATAPVAGGDTSTSTRLRLSDGTTALIKTHPHAPADFFVTEARGLTWLAETATVSTPAVLAVDADCLVLRWIEPGKPSGEAAGEFGEALARLHAADAGESFGARGDGYISTLRLPNGLPGEAAGGGTDWAAFFAQCRIEPYLKLAVDRGNIAAADAAAVGAVRDRLGEFVPAERPARLHGDLWNGNVLWALDGGVHVIDPAAHAGHRESDLAMLSLFGLPHLSRVFEAYEATAPLAEGWLDRLGLHQLFPLLVHAARFGGGYGARAGSIARSFA